MKEEIRKKAEQMLKQKSQNNSQDAILHELQVHQIELELQNEELLKTQQNLEELKDKYFQLYHFAPFGYVTIDQDNQILEINQKALELLDIGREKALQKKITHWILPDYQDSFYFYLQGIRENKKLMPIEIGFRRSQAILYVKIEALKHPIREDYFNLSFVDISDLKEKQALLEKKNQEFSSILDSFPSALFLVDSQANILHMNEVAKNMQNNYVPKASLLGNYLNCIYSIKDSRGCGFSNQCQKCVIRNVIKQTLEKKEGIKNVETIFLLKQEEKLVERYFYLSSAFLFYENKECVLLNIQDISDLKITQKKLKNSNDDLMQFAYLISHDLKEPLRMINSFLGLIKKNISEEIKTNKEIQEYIDFTMAASLRLNQMIQGLLEYSKMEVMPKANYSVDLEEVYQIVYANLELLIQETGASIKKDRLPTVIAEKSQMISLFQNLLSNALKYRKKEVTPVIEIRVEEFENEFLFSIQDNGIGFDMAFQDKIFKIFQRLHNREEYEGTGIGLALCKKIVERYEGRIWAESEIGKGSTFYFTLPRIYKE